MVRVTRHVLDARGLLCPMPVIRTQQTVESLQNGDELEVLCTDPGALQDIPAWCRVHGHVFVGAYEGEDELRLQLTVCR